MAEGAKQKRPRLTPKARLESNSIVILVEGKLDAKLYRYLAYAVAVRNGLSCRYCEAGNKDCSANPAQLISIVDAVAPGYRDEAKRWLECSTEDEQTLVTVVAPVNGYGEVKERIKAICRGTAASRVYIGVVDGDEYGPRRRAQRLLEELRRSCTGTRWERVGMICDTVIAATHASRNVELYLAVQGLEEGHPLKLTPGRKAEIGDYIPLVMEELGLDPHRVLECMSLIQDSPQCGSLRYCKDSRMLALTAQLLYCATNPMSLPDVLAKTCSEQKWRERLAGVLYHVFYRASPCIVKVLEHAFTPP